MPDPYTLISAEETELWHVYKSPYLPTSFNPDANGRFAARAANPSRAMLYAGNSSDCALWETVLRDVVPQPHPPHVVVIPPVAGYHITRLRPKHSTSILDLTPLGVRWPVGDRKRRDRIAVLATVPKYSATHGEAVRLLTEFPQTAGLSWISRQTGDIAYVFYEPPLSSDVFEAIERIALDSPRGAQLIDRALARAGMHRLDSSALAEELEQELSPDLE